MDYQEVIYCMKVMADEEVCEDCNYYQLCDHTKQADMARIVISAMDELQQYKQLGTMEEVREAVEKQKKKKPKGDLHSVPHYRCPNCNSTVKLYQNSKKDEICKWCGQRIEWSEVENE